MNSSHKKVALVTGANKGLGFEISRQLAVQDIKVVMGIRDVVKGQQAVEQLLKIGLDVEARDLDVTSIKSIDVMTSYLTHKFGKLDILVNNAGVCLDAGLKPSEVSLDIIRQTSDTNFIGVVAITQALLPLIYQ